MTTYRKHYHVCWRDRQADPQAHILCLTAYNEMDAVKCADEYLGESLGHVEMIVEKENDYLDCTVED